MGWDSVGFQSNRATAPLTYCIGEFGVSIQHSSKHEIVQTQKTSTVMKHQDLVSVRVIFIESVSSQSYLNFFQVRVESQELLSNFESLVWKLESNEIFHFFYVFCLRRNGAQHAAKMAPDKIKNGARCCFCKFHCKLFISKFFTKAVPILLLLLISLISTSLAQPCCNKYTSMSFA